MRLISSLLLLGFFSSCQQLLDAPLPNLYWEKFDAATTKPLQPATRMYLEGIYVITASADDFGDSAAVKWSYDISGKDTSYYLSFFCKEDVRFFVMQGKSSGDSILLNGYWRNIENTKTGKAHFIIGNKNGAYALLNQPTASPQALTIRGLYGLGEDEPEKEINFTYNRPLHNRSPFQIIAHRGGGRSNDLLPASENSLEMIHLASRMGANGVEIDVQLTKDSIAVLYHDAQINDRLTHKTGIHGPIDEYSYAELSKEVKLKRGGTIPTLKDALHTIVYNTPLQFVWLDCKYIGSMAILQSLQQEYTEKAAAIGKNIEIVIGVPDEDVLKNFMALPGFEKLPSLSELEQEKAVTMKAKIWATTWTKGLQAEEVNAAKARGMRSFAWTLDAPRKIKEFMREGSFDGIVTNRPTAVAYEYYSRK